MLSLSLAICAHFHVGDTTESDYCIAISWMVDCGALVCVAADVMRQVLLSACPAGRLLSSRSLTINMKVWLLCAVVLLCVCVRARVRAKGARLALCRGWCVRVAAAQTGASRHLTPADGVAMRAYRVDSMRGRLTPAALPLMFPDALLRGHDAARRCRPQP